jgi:hypothetical protein
LNRIGKLLGPPLKIRAARRGGPQLHIRGSVAHDMVQIA